MRQPPLALFSLCWFPATASRYPSSTRPHARRRLVPRHHIEAGHQHTATRSATSTSNYRREGGCSSGGVRSGGGRGVGAGGEAPMKGPVFVLGHHSAMLLNPCSVDLYFRELFSCEQM
jgi:hypothetical protein